MGAIVRGIHQAAQAVKTGIQNNPGVYNRENLKWSKGVLLGIGTFATVQVIYNAFSEEEKKEGVDRYIEVYQKAVASQLTKEDVRKDLSNCFEGGKGVLATCPAFFLIYEAIHRSGLSWKHHAAQSLIRSGLGTCKSASYVIAMYSILGLVLPATRSQLMAQGVSEANAALIAKAFWFLGAGAPVETAGEAAGCGTSLSRMPLPYRVFATGLVSVRIASGVLLQQEVIAKGAQRSTSERTKDLAIMVGGTSLTQHLINGLFKTNGESYQALSNYVKVGGWKQFLLTAFHRTAFGFTLDEYNSRPSELPLWAQPEKSRVEEA